MSTSAVEVSIHATSPLLGVGAGLASSFFSSALAGSALASAAAFSGALSLSWAPAPPAAANKASMERIAISFFIFYVSLDRRGVCFAGAYAYDLLKVEHENLAVADLAGVGGFLDRFEHAIEHVGFYRRLDLHFRQEID